MYHNLKGVIKQTYGQDACNVGDEGGFAPNIQSNLEGVELLMQAIHKAGYMDKVCVRSCLFYVLVFDFFVAKGRRGNCRQTDGERKHERLVCTLNLKSMAVTPYR